MSSSILVIIALVAAIPLRWAVRIDERGVARRRQIGWDLWKWEAFASGRIHKGLRFSFVDPERPWWNRTLCLDNLSKDDIRWVMEQINSHYRLPPPPCVPDTLSIRFGLRKKAVIGASGIELTTGGRSRLYAWREIGRVHITRVDPVRRDFSLLEVFLPDSQIALGLEGDGSASPIWAGATHEEINGILHAYLPEERIDVDIRGERPAKREDAERALARERRSQRNGRIGQWFLLSAFVGCTVWSVASGEIVVSVLMAMMCGMVLLVLFRGVGRITRERIETIEKQIAEFDDIAGDD